MHKVLLIDDEKDIVESIGAILEDKLFCEVHTAHNGLDAFMKCQEEKYELILTDHKMPFMTGAALIIAIRTKANENQKTPIIMLSGFIDDTLRSSLAIEKVRFLEKPVSAQELIKEVQGLLI